jgi:hypothetical protein
MEVIVRIKDIIRKGINLFLMDAIYKLPNIKIPFATNKKRNLIRFEFIREFKSV